MTSMVPFERRGLSGLGVAFIVGVSMLVMLWPRLGLPWGGGLADLCGGNFMLPEMRSFETAGWMELRGVPHLGTLPTDPASDPHTPTILRVGRHCSTCLRDRRESSRWGFDSCPRSRLQRARVCSHFG